MRWKFFVAGMIILLSRCGNHHGSPAENGDVHTVVADLRRLLQEKDFFRLEAIFEKNKSTLAPADRLYFQAFIDEAFNRNDRALMESDSVLQTNELNDSALVLLAVLRSDCYFKKGAYGHAAEEDSIILNRYFGYLPKKEIDETKNNFAFHTALTGTAAPSIS